MLFSRAHKSLRIDVAPVQLTRICLPVCVFQQMHHLIIFYYTIQIIALKNILFHFLVMKNIGTSSKIPHRLNMGLKTRLSTFCTKRHKNPANLVPSRKINIRLARPIKHMKRTTIIKYINFVCIYHRNFKPEHGSGRLKKFIKLKHNYESTSMENMYVIGVASHSLDFRQSSGGFIHGFRYTGEIHSWGLFREAFFVKV